MWLVLARHFFERAASFRSNRLAWLTPYCSLADERYWDRHGLQWDFRFPRTPGSPGSVQILTKTSNNVNVRWESINVPVKNGPQTIKISELCQQCYFLKNGKNYMRVFSNYAQNYASTIYKSLLAIIRVPLFFVPLSSSLNSCNKAGNRVEGHPTWKK